MMMCRTTDRAGRAPTRPFCFSARAGWVGVVLRFMPGRVGGRRLKIHAGPGGWVVDFRPGARWASPGFFRILPRAKLRNPIPILMELRVIQG